MRTHEVTVGPLPAWMDRDRLLGEGPWRWDEATGVASATLSTHDAADLAARLRGLGFGGHALAVTARPPLPRPAVRAARTEDARRRRDTSPGFTRPGVQLDEEGRRSLTPEALALALGGRAKALGEDVHVVDACCGSGGNAIGFARAGCRVTALELDPQRCEQARHNARIHGVADRITFRCADARQVVADLTATLLFVDPPWGGWDHARTSLDDLPLLADLLDRATPAHVWAKVPPSFDPTTVPGARAEAWFGEAAGDRRRVKFVLLSRP